MNRRKVMKDLAHRNIQQRRGKLTVRRSKSGKSTARGRNAGRLSIVAFLRKYWKFLVATLVGILGSSVVFSCCSDNQICNGNGNINVRGDGNTIAPEITFNGNLIVNHVTLNFDGTTFEKYTMDEVLKGMGVTPEKLGLPPLECSVLLKDPPGLARLADEVERHYEAGRLDDAVRIARIGRDIIDPKITPYLNRACSIETAFASHITAVYLILAEEAWGKDDYRLARQYSHFIVGLWGERVTGDVYAFAAAIELDEVGGSDSVLCEEAVRRYRAGDLA